MSQQFLILLVCLFLTRVTGVFFTNCNLPIISSTGDVYNLSGYNNTLLLFNDIKTGNTYNVTLCTSSLLFCGLCNQAGYCEKTTWWSNCVGQYAAMEGLPNGEGIELQYTQGEFGRSGIVYLQCDPAVPGFVPKGIADNGNLFIAKGAAACSVGNTTPPVEPSASCMGLIPSSTGENYNLSGYIGLKLSTFMNTGRFEVSICENTIPNCGGCGNAGACLTTSKTFCDGMFNGTEALPGGQGVILNYVDGDFGFATKVVLKCDPTSRTFWNIKVEVTSQDDYFEAQGLGGCPVGTAFVPFGQSPSTTQTPSPSPSQAPTPADSSEVSTFDKLVGAGLIVGLVLLAAAVILLIVLLVRFKRNQYESIPNH